MPSRVHLGDGHVRLDRSLEGEPDRVEALQATDRELRRPGVPGLVGTHVSPMDADDAQRYLLDRAGRGVDAGLPAAYGRSGYDERIVAERVGGQQGGWGA